MSNFCFSLVEIFTIHIQAKTKNEWSNIYFIILRPKIFYLFHVKMRLKEIEVFLRLEKNTFYQVSWFWIWQLFDSFCRCNMGLACLNFDFNRRQKLKLILCKKNCKRMQFFLILFLVNRPQGQDSSMKCWRKETRIAELQRWKFYIGPHWAC